MKPGDRVIVRANGLTGRIVAMHEAGPVVAMDGGGTTIYSAAELIRVPSESELEQQGQQSMFGGV